MATKVTIKINVPAFNAYRNSDSVTGAVQSLGEEIQEAAQENVDSSFAREFESDGVDIGLTIHHGKSRVRARVFTRSLKGTVAEHTDRALSRAIQSH